MLSILLTPADGGTAWRHQLAPGEARAGWECVGPLGLARRVGRILGFPADPAPAPDRVAAWAARLERHDDGARSYSRSRRADPYGVASFLLGLRDRLRLGGWGPGPLGGSRRLEDLAALEALGEPALPPGFADVLGGLAGAVEHEERLSVGLAIQLAAPLEGFAPLLLRLLAALEGAGAAVAEAPEDGAAAPAGTDLGRLQRALLDPASERARLSGDGSFLLLDADTPVEAGELAAAVLATLPLGTTTVVAAAQAGALEAALARQGLPTLGLASPSRLRPHLQALPLRLALAFRPRDPFRAAELLLLPGAPLPARARRRLLAALGEMPGVGGPTWREAIEQAAGEAEGRAREEGAPDPAAAGGALRERIDDWFGGPDFDPRAGIPGASAAALCGMVARWAQARAGGAERGGDGIDAALWSRAASVARSLERTLLGLPAGRAIPQLQLAHLHDLAAGEGSAVAAFDAEAGRPALCEGPGDVLPGAAAVVWFGFAKGAGPGVAPEPWTDPEWTALAAAGVGVAPPGQARRFEAWGWRRPLLLAGERALLVRWRHEGPEPVGLHALADELRTRLAPGGLEACTLGSEGLLGGRGPVAVATAQLPAAPPVAPRPAWKVPASALEPRGPLSATSLEALLGCPFRWALEVQGQLRPGRGVDLPAGSRLVGSFAHRILEDMLLGDGHLDPAKATPAEAATWALGAFDARVAAEAAPLARPGGEVEREAARSLVGEAAAALLGHLRAGGWTPRAAEEEVSGTFAGLPVRGFVDLALQKGAEQALLDLKLSGARWKRQDLEEGKALQIALYASMLGRGRDLPPAGFLVLDGGELLTVHPRAFPGATVVAGPSTRETLEAAERAYHSWRAVLSKGILPVCADDLPWQEPAAEAGGPAPDQGPPAWRDRTCRYCKLTTLCRAKVGEGLAP